MSNSILTTIESWGLDLGENFGDSRNIPPDDRRDAMVALVDYLVKNFSATRDDVELFDHKIIQECVPQNEKLRKIHGPGFAFHAVSELYGVLDSYFEPKEIDLQKKLKSISAKIGIPYKERKTIKENKPGIFPKTTRSETLKIEQENENLLVVDKKVLEEEFLPPIDEEIKKIFGLNDRGEFDI